MAKKKVEYNKKLNHYKKYGRLAKYKTRCPVCNKVRPKRHIVPPIDDFPKHPMYKKNICWTCLIVF